MVQWESGYMTLVGKQLKGQWVNVVDIVNQGEKKMTNYGQHSG